jgi:hypothetical protein
MEQVFPNLYVGNDDDVEKAKEKGFYILSACKDGPNGHRAMLGYDSHAAPKGKEYLVAQRGNHMVLNLVDANDPAFISDEAVEAGLAFIEKNIENHKILVHCNRGESRSPSIAMLFMRKIKDLPERFREGFKIFKTLYPAYKPALGMEFYTQKKYSTYKEQHG